MKPPTTGGERRVFEGVVKTGVGLDQYDDDAWGEVFAEGKRYGQEEWVSFNPPTLIADLHGKRVRVTVEVIDDEQGRDHGG